MRAIAIFIGILLLFMISAAIAVEEKQGNPENQPSIYIKDLTHDMGTIFEKEYYAYAYVVKNTGKADLVIDSVKPG
jgi:hypothetical protein